MTFMNFTVAKSAVIRKLIAESDVNQLSIVAKSVTRRPLWCKERYFFHKYHMVTYVDTKKCQKYGN